MILSVIAIASETSERLQIKGGFMGGVTFSHDLHNNIVNSCQKCHAVFPQKLGAIQELKDNKTLRKKHVMKQVCISCHKSENSGPTMCYRCHHLIFNFIPSGCLL
jgi:ribosomal protein L40E